MKKKQIDEVWNIIDNKPQYVWLCKKKPIGERYIINFKACSSYEKAIEYKEKIYKTNNYWNGIKYAISIHKLKID